MRFPSTLLEFRDPVSRRGELLGPPAAGSLAARIPLSAVRSRGGHFLATRRLEQCRSCRYQGSVTAGTVFHGTRVPLRSALARGRTLHPCSAPRARRSAVPLSTTDGGANRRGRGRTRGMPASIASVMTIPGRDGVCSASAAGQQACYRLRRLPRRCAATARAAAETRQPAAASGSGTTTNTSDALFVSPATRSEAAESKTMKTPSALMPV